MNRLEDNNWIISINHAYDALYFHEKELREFIHLMDYEEIMEFKQIIKDCKKYLRDN